MIEPSKIHFVLYSDGRSCHLPMAQFSHYKGKVKYCRWSVCKSQPKAPYREYCSEKCHDAFEVWYWKIYKQYFSWDKTKEDVWERDDGKCQLCGQQCNTTAGRPDSAEYDHIVPVSLAQALYVQFYGVYDFRFYTGIVTNRKNVRLLCNTCHKAVTARFLSKYFKGMKILTDVQKQIMLEAGFDSAMFPENAQGTLTAFMSKQTT